MASRPKGRQSQTLTIQQNGLIALIGILAAAILIPDLASAQDLSPVSNMLTTVQIALTGPIGRAIATIAVIGVGYACFLGRLNWTLFAMVLVGAVLVFFADDLIDGFAA